jgi:hypothetical protein
VYKTALHILFFIATITCCDNAMAQKGSSDTTLMEVDSMQITNGICKFLDFQFFKNRYYYTMDTLGTRNSNALVESPKNIVIHGNVLYDFSYRSYLDTPFMQNDVMQHFVQTKFNVVLKNKYPFTVTLTHRNSNSPYFRNATDVNVDFSQKQLLENIKTKLKAQLQNPLQNVTIQQLYGNLQNDVISNQAAITNAIQWRNSAQRIVNEVEEKETLIKEKLDAVLQLKSPSNLLGAIGNGVNIPDAEFLKMLALEKLKSNKNAKNVTRSIGELDSVYKVRLQKNKEKIDSLQQLVNNKQKEINGVKKKYTDSVEQAIKKINNIRNLSDLTAYLKEQKKGQDSFLTKTQKVLLSIKKIGIGRSWIDYSDLTAKNISLTGFNMEWNAGNLYFATAIGKVNYRFRDFIFKNEQSVNAQRLNLFRIGYGKKEKNNIILTHYNGRKAILNNLVNNTNPLQKVVGFSVEANYQLNADNQITVELAKSSYNVNANDNQNLWNKSVDFKQRANEAYSIKLQSYNPITKTKLTANYRKIGEYFQSFNLNPINFNQESWAVKVQQKLMKEKLSIEGGIRKNDFLSPIAIPNYNTKTIFKSAQLTLRVPKYPFVSIGYYPTNLLSLQNSNILLESQYNTLNGIVSHSYYFKKIAMNSSANYTQFFNNSTDSAFLYFNATNINFSHSFFFKKITATTSIGHTKQNQFKMTSLEQGLQCAFSSTFSITGALKYNSVLNATDVIGGGLGVQFLIKKIGRIQLNYDKMYLPNQALQLLPVDMGRLIYITEF